MGRLFATPTLSLFVIRFEVIIVGMVNSHIDLEKSFSLYDNKDDLLHTYNTYRPEEKSSLRRTFFFLQNLLWNFPGTNKLGIGMCTNIGQFNTEITCC